MGYFDGLYGQEGEQNPYLPPEYYDPQQSPYNPPPSAPAPYQPPPGAQTFPVDPNNPSGPLSPTPTAPAPTAPAPAQTPAAAWPQYTGDVLGYLRAIQAARGLGPTADALPIFIEGLKAAGISVERPTHAGGTALSDDKLLINGQIYDLINDVGSPNASWNWSGPQGAGGEAPSAPPINPEYLEPFTEPGPEIPKVPEYVPGQFTQPNAEDIYKDPSYTFRVGEGQKAIENSAAARGTLNSGGTLKDILNYGQKAGSQEWQSMWDRSFKTWDSNEGNRLTGWRENKGVTDDSYNRAWDQYVNRRDTFYKNQQNPWDKQMDAARLGAGL